MEVMKTKIQNAVSGTFLVPFFMLQVPNEIKKALMSYDYVLLGL